MCVGHVCRCSSCVFSRLTQVMVCDLFPVCCGGQHLINTNFKIDIHTLNQSSCFLQNFSHQSRKFVAVQAGVHHNDSITIAVSIPVSLHFRSLTSER